MNIRLKSLTRTFICLGLAALLSISSISSATEDPVPIIKSAVDSMVVSFTADRQQLENSQTRLFHLVDRIAGPLFDFDYISKLVLAGNWKTATSKQRREFAHELKRLLIATYAIALFQYTGNETMSFDETRVKQKKSIKFASVRGQFQIDNGTPIDMVYSMVQKPGENWKIYNLTVADLNMVLNYRNVIQSSIHKDGFDGTIALMKTNNDRSYSSE